MSMTLLNPDQARRVDTHLALLAADLSALAAAPEMQARGPGATAVRDAVATTNKAAEGLRVALELPKTPAPSLRHRVAAVAGVWAARVDDISPARLRSYGAVHPDLPSHIEAPLRTLRLSLERLADAAAALP
jgi:hypothetical protein